MLLHLPAVLGVGRLEPGRAVHARDVTDAQRALGVTIGEGDSVPLPAERGAALFGGDGDSDVRPSPVPRGHPAAVPVTDVRGGRPPVRGVRPPAYGNVPVPDTGTRTAMEVRVLPARFGGRWTRSVSINDLYLADAVSAFQRIGGRLYQAAAVPEPLSLRGGQIADGFDRAFSGRPAGGCVPPVLVSTAADSEGGLGLGPVRPPGGPTEDRRR